MNIGRHEQPRDCRLLSHKRKAAKYNSKEWAAKLPPLTHDEEVVLASIVDGVDGEPDNADAARILARRIAAMDALRRAHIVKTNKRRERARLKKAAERARKDNLAILRRYSK